jgi:hypothetical protein
VKLFLREPWDSQFPGRMGLAKDAANHEKEQSQEQEGEKHQCENEKNQKSRQFQHQKHKLEREKQATAHGRNLHDHIQRGGACIRSPGSPARLLAYLEGRNLQDSACGRWNLRGRDRGSRASKPSMEPVNRAANLMRSR